MMRQVLPPLSEKRVRIFFEGESVDVPEGTTVAAAVLCRGAEATRITHKGDERAPYCHIGVCFECLMEIDGRPNQQSCLITVREGMHVRRQKGAPDFAPHREA